MSQNFILILIFIIGVPSLITVSGLAGVFICDKTNFLKKNLDNEKILWINFFINYFFYIVYKPNFDYMTSLGAALGHFLIPFISSVIYSVIRNRHKTKKTDAKFYYFFFGVTIISIIGSIVTIYRGKF